MNCKILIVNFNFPPSSSIGGRRWSYMAEALANLNFEIHVITSDFLKLTKENLHGLNVFLILKNITYLPHRNTLSCFK